VLVVVEDGNVQRLIQAPLDFEAARRADVLQVDAAERRGEGPYRGHDLVHVLRVQADRHRVHPAELLEQHGLALHDRQRGARADVAESQHGRTVGDDRDCVPGPGVVVGEAGLGGDGLAHPGHPRGVREGEVLPAGQRDGRGNGHLAAPVPSEDRVSRVHRGR